MEHLYEEHILITYKPYVERVSLWVDEITWMKHWARHQ